jgi:RNA polymerase sigma-70 factor (ECF subfamily)
MTVLEFDSKFNQLSKLLQSFAYNLTKNLEDSKDLFQETAFRAMTNREKFRPDTNFKAWLFTIMKNIFINNYRKKVKANTIMDSTDNQYFINSSSTMIPNRADSQIMMQELNKMIGELDDSIQVPFMMHYQGYKYQEIADDLALPLGTVKSRIFFARKELKNRINAHFDNIGKDYERNHAWEGRYSSNESFEEFSLN